MNLARELREHIRAYITGEVSLGELREWLDIRAQAIVDADDTRTGALAARAWTLFAELDYEHRDEHSVCAELSQLLPPVNTVAGTIDVELVSHFQPSAPRSIPHTVPLAPPAIA